MPKTKYHPKSIKDDIASREEAKVKRNETSKPAAKKRKTPTTSERSNKRTRRTASDPISSLKFLLSDDAQKLTMTPEEIKNQDKNSKPSKTFTSTDLSPFEMLLCTQVLARPISHRLGARAITTLLNEPYNFNTPESLADATDERRWEALAEARTQHKVKTAESLGKMAKIVIERFSMKQGDGSLEKLREAAEQDADEERKILVDAIKGFGPTSADILLRRLQAGWPEQYPCADKRSLAAVTELGIPAGSAKELANFVEQHRREIGVKEGDEGLRQAFVLILERAVGIEIERKMDEARDMIESSQ